MTEATIVTHRLIKITECLYESRRGVELLPSRRGVECSPECLYIYVGISRDNKKTTCMMS